MRLLLVTLALLPLGTAAPLSFGTPAQGAGALDIEVEGWVVVLFDGKGDAEARLLAPFGGTVTNQTFEDRQLRTPEAVVPVPLVFPPMIERMGAIDAALRFGQGSLVVWADRLSLDGAGALQLASSGDGCIAPYLTPAEIRAFLVVNHCTHRPQAVLRLEPDDVVKFVAHDARAIAWTGANVTCSSTECVHGGHRDSASVVVGQNELRERRVSFIRLDGPQQLHLSGYPAALLVLGPALDFGVEGWLRLPAAVLDEDPCGCFHPGNQTFWASGELRLDGVAPETPRRLSSSFGGRVDFARLDESPLDATFWTTAAIAGTGLLFLVFAVQGFLGPLFTRHTAETALEHEKRRHLMATIEAHPGATFRELVRRTQIYAGTARHHLAVMKRARLIMERPHGHTLRYFPNHGRFDRDWNELVFLREPALKRLHEWLLAHPKVIQADILEATTIWGWSRSTTQHRLRRLVEGGLVTERPQGRRKLYTVEQKTPVGAVGWGPVTDVSAL